MPYLAFGAVIESDVRLASVEAVARGDAPSLVTIASRPPAYFDSRGNGLAADPGDWIDHAVLADGDLYMKVADIFQAVISADGRRIACRKLGDTDDRTFEANLMNFALAAALTLQGEEILHATVVELDGRAVGFVGSSGAGKSTLAAALLQAGARLVTDDMLRLDFADGVPLAHAGPCRLKLFEEVAARFLPGLVSDGSFNGLTGKLMLWPCERPPSPLPLAALFVLGDAAEDVTATRLAGLSLIKAVIAATMNLRYQAPDRLARHMKFAERLGRVLPVYELAYPRTWAALPEVVQQVRRVAPPHPTSPPRGGEENGFSPHAPLPLGKEVG
jgi:hypothetical protein